MQCNDLKEIKVKQSLKIASVFIGTIVGAGLASGQEILQFFARFGMSGFAGIALCCALYITAFIVIIRLCINNGYRSYKDIIFAVLGKRLGAVIDFFLTIFIFGSSIIMISGGGAMLKEYANLPYFAGIFLMCLLVFVMAVFSTEGVITLNSVVVPFSALTIGILGILVFIKSSSSVFPLLNNVKSCSSGSPYLSTLLYASFNILGATGVICPIIYESKDKKHFIQGAVIGSIVLTALAVSICFSILVHAPGSMVSEIPNLYIARSFGRLYAFITTMVIWLEMFSTEISNIYSLSKRLEYSFRLPYIGSLLIIMGLTVPFSFIGFSRLIKLLYPPFGAVSLIFVCGCVYMYLKEFPVKFKKS
jgi:uncharacterized membrane protein YkvI